MSTFENGDKPSISQIKPITTSEVSELDGSNLAAAAELNDRLRGKLVLKPWRTRHVMSFHFACSTVIINCRYLLNSTLSLNYTSWRLIILFHPCHQFPLTSIFMSPSYQQVLGSVHCINVQTNPSLRSQLPRYLPPFTRPPVLYVSSMAVEHRSHFWQHWDSCFRQHANPWNRVVQHNSKLYDRYFHTTRSLLGFYLQSQHKRHGPSHCRWDAP